MGQDVFSWQESLTNTYEAFVSQLIAFAPRLVGAIALLFAGWIVAHALRMTAKKIVIGFDSLFQRAARADGKRQERMKSSYAVIISKVVFWTVIIFFIAATGNMLGWSMFSNWMSNFIIYLPNLISGLLIILGGYLLSQGAKTAVGSAASSVGFARNETLARVAQIVILFTALVIGIKQIGINLDFLTDVLIVIVGILLLGGALAFSLGSQTLIANVIGAQYVRKHCRIGELMKMGDVEGSVVEVTQTSVVLDTDDGRTIIPAKHFQEHITSFKSKHESSPDQGPKNAGEEVKK